MRGAMRANVELSKDCHKAWCARLAWFLKCIGVLSCEEMDMCNLHDIVGQAVLLWAEMQATTPACGLFVICYYKSGLNLI
jgi:hypothetical protein